MIFRLLVPLDPKNHLLDVMWFLSSPPPSVVMCDVIIMNLPCDGTYSFEYLSEWN